MRALRRQQTKQLAKQQTMGGTSNENNYIQENIFAMQARFDAEIPDDREKPRANLYNVIKCLREDAVSDFR